MDSTAPDLGMELTPNDKSSDVSAASRLQGMVMCGPKRIQRKRKKDWRMPEGAVYVGRGSKWGNPCKIEHESQRADAVAWFEAHIAPKLDVRELRGKDLACWCRLDQECHADILLKLANT